MSARLSLVDPGRELDLGVGSLVVYGAHGLGRVTAGQSVDVTAATVCIEFESGLSVILPLERAEACLRPPAGANELEAIGAVLRSRDTEIEESWQARSRATRTKIALGETGGLAEVVRDAIERKRRSAPGWSLSTAEQELYRKARHLLAAELAVAAGLDEDGADNWIELQLEGGAE